MAFFDSIRLKEGKRSARFIQLHVSDSSEESGGLFIRGTLNVFFLDEAPEYEALSYTWGKEGQRIDIQLNNQSFSVSPNLYAALRQFSRGQKGALPRRLWIDAICINQRDNDEKSKQVMQMTEIYTKARRVLLWLGDPDEFTSLAFDTLRRFARDDGTTDGSVTYRDLLATRKQRVEAIGRLAERPYFARVWVIQEAVAARVAVVVCGDESMDLIEFSRAFSRLTGSGLYPHALAINVTGLGNWRKYFQRPPSKDRDDAVDLQALLMYSRDKLCQNARDKVYALRGISTQRFAEGVIVDYKSPVERVYIDCAKHWLSIRSDLRVLSTIEPRHSANPSALKLPSWVPDWSQHNHPSGVMQRYFRFLPGKMFRASGKSVANVSFDEKHDVLAIKGKRFDTIERVISAHPTLLGTGDEKTLLTPSKFLGFLDQLGYQDVYGHTGEAFPNAALRTVTADRTGLSARVADSYRCKYLTAYSNWRLESDSSITDLPEGAWKELSNSVAQILDDKDLFITSNGYMGVARSGFATGDLVCVLLGGEVPFILRQLDTERESFRMVTECYVHGIMDGELMHGGNDAKDELFCIS